LGALLPLSNGQTRWKRDVYHIGKISDTSLLYIRMNFFITVTISQLTESLGNVATLKSNMNLFHKICRGCC